MRVAQLALVAVAVVVAGCSGPSASDGEPLPGGTPGASSGGTQEGPSSVEGPVGPQVHRAWFNATADALSGRVVFLTNGLTPPTAAGIFLFLPENVTDLIVEVRWDDSLDGVALSASALHSNCQGFPPPLGEDCVTHYARSYVDREDDGYWTLGGEPGSTTQLALVLGPDDLRDWLPADWEFFGFVETVGADVHVELVVSVFTDQEIPEGYTAFTA